MDILLTETEVRVLGSLIEKELATPEYYPLTLNSLLNACNQKTSREPVVNYDERIVLEGLAGLKNKRIVWETSSGRATKYEENFLKPHTLVRAEAAALCMLMLRGPRTIGEIRNQSERLYAFKDLDEATSVMDTLIDMGLAVKLPRLPGHKEARFCHLLCGEPKIEAEAYSTPIQPEPLPAQSERLTQLEEQVQTIKEELESLKETFRDFRKQFE